MPSVPGGCTGEGFGTSARTGDAITRATSWFIVSLSIKVFQK